MSEEIISLDRIRRLAQQAHDRGADIADCPYPQDSAAGRAWIAQFQWLQSVARANTYQLEDACASI